MITLTSPLTGAAQTGLTSPTYTLTADVAPDNNGKQWAVTGIGGTQAGVTAHTLSSPFTLTAIRPKSYKVTPPVNALTGVLSNVPKNTTKFISRKGLICLAGQAPVIGTIYTEINIPAGADTADANSVRALLSSHIGGLTQFSAGLGDTVVTGVI